LRIRLDQIPLAHLRAAGDVLVLGDLGELLAVAIVERTARQAAALTTTGSLLTEFAARAPRKARDRALPPRRLLCVLTFRFAASAWRADATVLTSTSFRLLGLYPRGRVLIRRPQRS
jgi:hypothetical protein